MSTFTLPDSKVKVTLTENLNQDQLLKFPAFDSWKTRLQHNLGLQNSKEDHEFHSNPYELKGIIVQSVDIWGKGPGFIKLSADVSRKEPDENGNFEKLDAILLMRGASVGMMVILQPNDLPESSKDEKYVLLTVQPRIPAASLTFTELPAGMVDDGTFAGKAAQEIKEELDLDIPESQLTNLSELADPPSGSGEKLPVGFFPSAGGCDEVIQIFLHQKKIHRSQLKEWTGKLTGLREEGEKITLKLIPLKDLWKEGARDAKALSAWALYSGLTEEGKLSHVAWY